MRLMARKVMFLLAFLAAFGQAVAIAAFPRAAADEIGHAFAHVQEPSHHHHDDGLMHVMTSEPPDGNRHTFREDQPPCPDW